MCKKLFLSCIAILFALITTKPAHAKGIIIGNDTFINNTFKRSNPNQIKDFAKKLGEKYDAVILHLGSKYQFSNGSFFDSPKSQSNLKIFSDQLAQQKISLYLWFIDSYGAKLFKNIYDDYPDIIGHTKHYLDSLRINYQGIVLDMEWINRPIANNNKKYLEILSMVRDHFPEKSLYVFASLIDNTSHNIQRGFPEKEIINLGFGIIPMLYPLDGGFFLDYNQIKLRLHDNRIDDLRTYYSFYNYKTAVSIEQGVLWKKFRKVQLINHASLSDTLFNHFTKRREDKYQYYSIIKFKAKSDIYVPNIKGEDIFVKRKKKIYYLKIADKLIEKDDFIWEYIYTLQP